ncbi:MAG: helix-turn-helix domain-containing protein [Actinomycetia bacterium]|nr:helix-turn-helix domain-containing protein [Actinomycetes bacterium]
MLQNVAVLALPGIAPFELGVVCEVFGIDRSDVGLPAFDFAVVSEGAAPVTTSSGFTIAPEHALDRAELADLICVPASDTDCAVSPAVRELLHQTIARGGRIMSVCSGAFTLAAAGLLDDRPCTTHWFHMDEFTSRFPRAQVVPDVLYVDDGPIITSAGSAAGIDACLHVVRQELGAAVANGIARRMVVPAYREGGQAQFIERPVPDTESVTLGPLLDWMTENIDVDVSVDELAARAHLSPRTFARRFKAETGSTPHAWLTRQRVQHAQRLLEETDEPIERIAGLCGFGSATLLRHHFVRQRGTTPQAFRRAFRSCGRDSGAA